MTAIQWADPGPGTPPKTTATPEVGGVQHASEQGTHLELLIALRHNISAAIDTGVAARDLAALSRRLIEIDREVRALSKEEADPVADGLNQDADDWPSA